jgi:hypothetical protein
VLIHYFGAADGFESAFTPFASENVFLIPDFHPPVPGNPLFQIAKLDTGADERQNILNALNDIASKLAGMGGTYTAVLPYAFLDQSLASGLNKLIDAMQSSERRHISQNINLDRTGRIDDFDLQFGRYAKHDCAGFQLQPDGSLTTRSSAQQIYDFPYVIFRIDPRIDPAPHFDPYEG